MVFIYSILCFILGATIGSFLNVVILRTHEGKSLDGRSSCPHCKHQLSVFDLIPILSYLSLNGKCRYCQHKFSAQYPIVELVTAIAFSFLFFNWVQNTINYDIHSTLTLLFEFFVTSVLIVVTVTDIKWGLIPDKVIIPASFTAFIFQLLIFLSLFLNGSFGIQAYFIDFCLTIITAFLIGLFFYLLIVATRGRGMGGGDFKLSIFIGLIFAWDLALLAIFLGFLTGAIGSVMLLLTGKKALKSSVPFGPFLALGAALTLLLGKQVLEIYLKTLGL